MTEDAASKPVTSLVLSRLDYCNALLHNIQTRMCNQLQRVLHAAARIVKCSRKYDHVGPDLIQLHWIPARQRIQYKVALLVHNTAQSTERDGPDLHSGDAV